MKKRFMYRISITIRLFFCIAAGIFVLGCYGYLDESFNTDSSSRILSLLVFVPVLLVSIFSPYKDSFIETDEFGVSLPSLFIPPFRKRRIEYRDIQSLDVKSDNKGMQSLVIKTRKGKFKINGYFCYKKIRATLGAPDEFWAIHGELTRHYEKESR